MKYSFVSVLLVTSLALPSTYAAQFDDLRSTEDGQEEDEEEAQLFEEWEGVQLELTTLLEREEAERQKQREKKLRQERAVLIKERAALLEEQATLRRQQTLEQPLKQSGAKRWASKRRAAAKIATERQKTICQLLHELNEVETQLKQIPQEATVELQEDKAELEQELATLQQLRQQCPWNWVFLPPMYESHPLPPSRRLRR